MTETPLPQEDRAVHAYMTMGAAASRSFAATIHFMAPDDAPDEATIAAVFSGILGMGMLFAVRYPAVASAMLTTVRENVGQLAQMERLCERTYRVYQAHEDCSCQED